MHKDKKMRNTFSLNNTKTNKSKVFLIQLFLLFLLQGCNSDKTGDLEILGFWTPEKYVMSNGDSKEVSGHISFGKNQWSVVFFILDEDGKPVSSSAEGGEYQLKNDNLTFWHSYNFSDVSKGTSGDLTKIIYEEDDRLKEFCHIEIEDDILVIYFPSGNAMIFSKSV